MPVLRWHYLVPNFEEREDFIATFLRFKLVDHKALLELEPCLGDFLEAGAHEVSIELML